MKLPKSSPNNKIVGVHCKTVQVWLSKFRKLGLSSVRDAPRCGAPKKITGAAEKSMYYALYRFQKEPKQVE